MRFGDPQLSLKQFSQHRRLPMPIVKTPSPGHRQRSFASGRVRLPLSLSLFVRDYSEGQLIHFKQVVGGHSKQMQLAIRNRCLRESGLHNRDGDREYSAHFSNCLENLYVTSL
jgi:hypothetical protein